MGFLFVAKVQEMIVTILDQEFLAGIALRQ